MNNATAVRNYKIVSHPFSFSHGMFPLAMLLRDVLVTDSSWETFDEQSLRGYFENGCRVFLSRVEQFKSLRQPLTVKDEKELKFMLEALIAAKKTLEEGQE